MYFAAREMTGLLNADLVAVSNGLVQVRILISYKSLYSLCNLSVIILQIFQSRSYATFLASWGYAVLQYDLPILFIAQDIVEVTPDLSHMCKSLNSSDQ